jgi:hypothetical protein
MFTVTLFITVKTWKQSRCPSGGEWIVTFADNGIFKKKCAKYKRTVKLWKDMEEMQMNTKWKKPM